jgi:hypothetical protein
MNSVESENLQEQPLIELTVTTQGTTLQQDNNDNVKLLKMTFIT